MRFIAWITAAYALSVGATFLILGLGPLAGGVWIAVAAAVVLIAELVNAVRRDRDAKRRRVAEAEWQRRLSEMRPRWNALHDDVQDRLFDGVLEHLADMKPWPIGDDEVRR